MPFDGSVEDEIRRFEEQYRRQPESLVFARLADACRKAGDPERALTLLEEGIARHPDYLSAHIVRARTFRDVGREVEARAAFERVLELDGQNLVAMRGLADLARRRNDSGDERRWLRRLVQADPFSPEPAERLAALGESAPERRRDGDAVDAEPGPGPETDAGVAESSGVEPEIRPEPESGGSAEDEVESEEGFEAEEEVEAEEGFESEEGFEAEEGFESDEEVESDVTVESDETEVVSAGEDRLPDPWWFESPEAEVESPDREEETDADLLTRTMAELYARQGLLDEAEAIYRELLRDRPDDGELRAGLDSVLGMRAARSATRGSPPPTRPEPEASAARETEAGGGGPGEGEATGPGGGAEAAPTVPEELRELLAMGSDLARRLPATPEEEPRSAAPAGPPAAPGPEPASEGRSVLEDWLRGLRG